MSVITGALVRLRDQAAEAPQVHLLGSCSQNVTTVIAGQRDVRVGGPGQYRPQPGHVAVQDVAHRGGRIFAPHPVDQELYRYHVPQVEEQHREHRPLPGMPGADDLTSRSDLDWSENPVLHTDSQIIPPEEHNGCFARSS